MCSRKIEIKPIGSVKRASPEEDVTDKSLVSEIVVEKGFAKALVGIEDFSHVFIIFWMHKTSETEKAVLQVHPRGRSELPLVGTLADRGPNHPNPFGLTLVEVIKRRENVLWVRGLDAYDRTPVLDIKPYGCPCEVVTDSRTPKWFYEK